MMGEGGRKTYPYTTDTAISELWLVANGQISVIAPATAVKGIMTLSGPADEEQYTSVWKNPSKGGSTNQLGQRANPQKIDPQQTQHLQLQRGRKQIRSSHPLEWRMQTGRSSLLVKSVSHVNQLLFVVA